VRLQVKINTVLSKSINSGVLQLGEKSQILDLFPTSYSTSPKVILVSAVQSLCRDKQKHSNDPPNQE